MSSPRHVTKGPRRLPPIPLDRSSKVPLYRQIEEHVRQMLAGKTAGNGRVFTEQELAERFGVSRLTVRHAITALVAEGKLVRVRGVGTLRISASVTESLERVRDHFVDWELEGRSVCLRNLEFTDVEVGSGVAARLQIPERTEVQRLVRLWIVDGIPIALVYFYLHPSIGRRLSVSDVENTHVRAAVSRLLRKPMLGEQVEIEAAVASRVMAERLQIRPGAPVLIGRLTQFYADQRPLVAADCFYRADLYRYSVYVPAESSRADAAVHVFRSRPVTARAIAGRRPSSE
jgi:GntR family transcriptional regulator